MKKFKTKIIIQIEQQHTHYSITYKITKQEQTHLVWNSLASARMITKNRKKMETVYWGVLWLCARGGKVGDIRHKYCMGK